MRNEIAMRNAATKHRELLGRMEATRKSLEGLFGSESVEVGAIDSLWESVKDQHLAARRQELEIELARQAEEEKENGLRWLLRKAIGDTITCVELLGPKNPWEPDAEKDKFRESLDVTLGAQYRSYELVAGVQFVAEGDVRLELIGL